ncbi:unnamed protein product, partial [Lymnaea stagnalis]
CAPRVLPTSPPSLPSDTPFNSTPQASQEETTPEIREPQFPRNTPATNSSVFPVETLAPATVATEPPLPFETMPPIQNGTQSPVATTESINYGETFPTETQTAPEEPTIPPDAELDD